VGSACLPPPAEEAADSCPDVLTVDACDGGSCPEVPLRPLIDRASAEVDEAASLGRAQVIGEQMWVNYYSAGGKVVQEVRLLNDATTGWNEDAGTEYEPPEDARVSYVWAVVHDNRGGTEWARLRICSR
jgi:hypothetical protein